MKNSRNPMFFVVSLIFIICSANAFAQDDSLWDGVLKKHIRKIPGSTQFNYAALKKDSKDFNAYLASLSAVSQSQYDGFSSDKKLSFLINAYNAFTVKLVVDNYPVKSIKDIGGVLSSPWKKKFVSLRGKTISLDDIEHGTIRKEFKEPRIHFAVNCASVGCPPLRNESYKAEKLSQQLDDQTKMFFNNGLNSYNASTKSVSLNPILKWYSEDFQKNGGMGVVAFAAQYMPSLTNALKQDVKVSVIYLDYSWDLNQWE